jgi:superfamily II DNA or RNA helicase
LIAAGVLAVPEVWRVETDFDFRYRAAEDYNALLAALAADPARNDLVAEHVATAAHAGHACLVLSGRLDHCEALRARLAARGVGVAVLSGEVPTAARRACRVAVRSGALRVLVATSLADEGLDLPRLARVFLAFPGRARGRTAQRLGRLMRPHPGKGTPVLVDFVDRRVAVLRRHHLERRRLYAEVLGAAAVRTLSATVPAGTTPRRGP